MGCYTKPFLALGDWHSFEKNESRLEKITVSETETASWADRDTGLHPSLVFIYE